MTNIGVLEGLNALLTYEAALLQGIVEDSLSLVVNIRIVRLDIPVGRYTDGLTVGTQSDNAGVSLLAGILANGVDECASQCLTNILNVCLLVESNNIVTTTGEVDALAQTANGERDAEQHSGDTPDDEALLIHTHEVVVGILHKVLRVTGYEGQVEPLVLLQAVLINQTCQEHCGEE